MESLGLPTGKAYLTEFLKRAVLPAKQKQSNTLFFLPGTGRTSLLRYAASRRDGLEKDLRAKFDSLLWLLVDFNNEADLKNIWLRLLKDQGVVAKEISAIEKLALGQILDHLANKLKKRVLLCPLIFDEGISVSRLDAWRQINSMMIDFQFSFPYEVKPEELKNYLDGLAQFALQNIWYMPLYSPVDIEAVIQGQVDQGFAKPTPDQRKKIIKLSGGYPRLIRYFLRNLDKIEVKSWQEPEVKRSFEDIWDGLSDTSRSWLFNITGDKNETRNPSEYIEKTGLVVQGGQEWQFFSPLFTKYVDFLSASKPPSVVEKAGVIHLNGKNIELLLSSQEVDVFRAVWEKRGQILSRDEIAQALWSKDWEEKYSDWAIDQVISRIRRKLGDRPKAGLIKTVRGKGFVVGE